MKKKYTWLIVVLAAGGILLSTVFQGCKSEGEGDSPKMDSAVKNSFYPVTSRLDRGGQFYMYASSERFIKGIETLGGKIRAILETQASKHDDGKQALVLFDFASKTLKDLGLSEISGIGISSVAVEKELDHSKIVVHHYKGNGNGLIWNLMEPAPHELETLRMLPADTVLASAGDFRVKTLWQWINKVAAASNIPQVKQAVASIEPGLKRMDIHLDKILDSLAGRAGFVIQLSRSRKDSIPVWKVKADLPEPSLAVFFKVKNDYLFNFLKEKLKFAKFKNEDGKKSLHLPVPPLPVNVKPVIVQAEGYLFFASNDLLVNEILEAKKAGQGLISTDEFKRMSQNIPDRGNGVRFVSSRFFKTYVDFQKNLVKASGEPVPPGVKAVFDLYPENFSLYGVIQNGPEGTVFIVNHSMGMETLFLAQAAFVTGVVAAIAIPNLVVAKSKGGQKAAMGDLKSVSIAVQSYIVDHEKAPPGKTTGDLEKLLVPFYIKHLPLKDPWGNDYLYRLGTGDDKTGFALACAGKDGVFDGWDQRGVYIVTTLEGFNNDIIIVDGKFVYGPKVK